LATYTASGGSTAATADIAMAAVGENSRTTFQASTMSRRQVPMSAKYHRRRRRWRSLRPVRASVTATGRSLSRILPPR